MREEGGGTHSSQGMGVATAGEAQRSLLATTRVTLGRNNNWVTLRNNNRVTLRNKHIRGYTETCKPGNNAEKVAMGRHETTG